MITLEKFEQKYTPEPNSGCWLWTAGVSPLGYGQCSDGPYGERRTQYAHRVAYELFKGPIPAGIGLDHLCRVRSCVNPDHLEPVSQRTNLMRGRTLAARFAAQTHCVHGHPFDETNTRRTKKGRECLACRQVWDKGRIR